MRPKRCRMAAKAACTAPASVQSAVIGSTRRPAASISRATALQRVALAIDDGRGPRPPGPGAARWRGRCRWRRR